MSGAASGQARNLRVVLDTNVIISALCFPQSLPQRVLQTVGEHHILLFSDALMEELETVLLRDKFDRYLSRKKRWQVLQELNTVATYIRRTSVLTDIQDTKDNEVLAVAVDGHADYLVTGNIKHFIVDSVRAKYPNIIICTPRDFYSTILEK